MVLFEKFVKLRRLRYLLADRGSWVIGRLALKAIVWALSILSMVLISHPDVRNPSQIFLSLWTLLLPSLPWQKVAPNPGAKTNKLLLSGHSNTVRRKLINMGVWQNMYGTLLFLFSLWPNIWQMQLTKGRLYFCLLFEGTSNWRRHSGSTVQQLVTVYLDSRNREQHSLFHSVLTNTTYCANRFLVFLLRFVSLTSG